MDKGAVMRMPDGSHNAHVGTQLRAVQESWRPIYEKHKDGIFEKRAFDSILGRKIRAAKQILHPITPEELIEEAISAKPSAAGLDQWRPEALKVLAKHCPALFEPLAKLLNLIEETGE